MDNNLALILNEKGLITERTEVETYYESSYLGNVYNTKLIGEFSVSNVLVSDDKRVVFKLRSLRDGAIKEVPASYIIKIDGMEPERYALVYDINLDGSKIKSGKRRGRKPKNRSLEHGRDY